MPKGLAEAEQTAVRWTQTKIHNNTCRIRPGNFGFGSY